MKLKTAANVHRWIARLSILGGLIATILATVSMINGFIRAYAVNAMVLIICSALTYFNLKRAKYLERITND